MHIDAEFFVTVAFVLFLGGAVYLGLHKKIGEALDKRGDLIRDELAEAARLRNEAAEVLASFEKKKADAEAEATSIVDQARAEAEMIAKDAEARMADFVKRRTAQAEAKIANAETQAMAQVRSVAADAATAAAEIVLKDQAKTGLADKLIDEGIGEVKRFTH